jgi:hypothetical protein
VRDLVKSSYLDQYEAPRQNFVPQRRRGGRHPIQSSRPYNTKRTMRMRISRGKESMRENSEALHSKVGVGLKEVEVSLIQIEANKTLTVVRILVTTKTMGFTADQIYFQSSAQRNPVYSNIYSFYRVNLAMSEAKLCNFRRPQEAPLQLADESYEVPARPLAIHAQPDSSEVFRAQCGL